MGAHVVTLQRTASTTQSLGNLTAPGSGMRRFAINDLELGSEAAAADNPFLYVLQRCTTVGTRTSVTPQPKDPADGACVTTAGQNHSVEPTYTANEIMKRVALNQRSTYRWYANPGDEIVVPATANNGIGIQTPTATGVVITASVGFIER